MDAVSHPRQVVVIGAGAAGCTAAIFAARAGADVRVLESATAPGAKIRVSGGGRCNVLPTSADEADFHTEGSSRTVRNLLRRWPLDEVRAFFADELEIPLKDEEVPGSRSGKVFPVSDDARDVVRALLDAVAFAGASIETGVRVTDLEVTDDGRVRLQVRADAEAPPVTVEADRVVIATGGLSLPKTGSDGAGYTFAEAIGHQLVPRYPALVPLHTDGWDVLAGLTLMGHATVRAGAVRWQGIGSLLFTHKGISGPLALDVSHQLTAPWGGDATLELGFGDVDDATLEAELVAGGTASVRSVLRRHLPRRLADHLVTATATDDVTLAVLTKVQRRSVVTAVTALPVGISGHGGYRLAEVTGGGVALPEVVTKTLASRLAPQVHFAGEVLDVTGRLGGFNFLWAWVSGRIAGESAATAG